MRHASAGLTRRLFFLAGVTTSAALARAGEASAPERIEGNIPSVPTRVLTAKERLGAKWKDEQRTDNCKVPTDKRGPTQRPDACINDRVK